MTACICRLLIQLLLHYEGRSYLCNQLLHPANVVHSLRDIFTFWDTLATSIGLLHKAISGLLDKHTQLPKQCLPGTAQFTTDSS